MTHDELARLRDAKDWEGLWPEAQCRADFSIKDVVDRGEPDYEDLVQEGHMAAATAMHDWDPLENALKTHIKMRVQGAISDYRRTLQTGGIGSRRTVADGEPAEHVSMSTEVGFDEEGGEVPTYLDELTYANTAAVPEGYGSIEQELERESRDEAIAFLMHGLTPEEAGLIRSYVMGDSTSREYAEETGVSHMGVQRVSKRILTKLFQKAKTCLELKTGIANWKSLKSHYPVRRRYPQFWADATGILNANPIWSEVTGQTHGPWEWKPDTETVAALERGDRKVAKRTPVLNIDKAEAA